MSESGTRWQYVVANVGMFGAHQRLATVLAHLGAQGFELVTVYDKASNWFQGMEKGFMLFKRPVPAGVDVEGPWCGVLDVKTLSIGDPSSPERYGYPEGQAW